MEDPPILDGRNRDQVLAALLARAPGYVPEWQVASGTAAEALFAILARDIEIQATAQNGMPDRARLGFLGTLGNSLLSAQSARAPLVFQLMATAPLDVTLIAGSEIAAKLPPPPPSLLGASQTAPTAPLFSTETTITLTRAALSAVYSVDPTADTFADHSASLATGFTFFSDMQAVPHQLYLGHDTLFALSGNADIEISVELPLADQQTKSRPMLIDWEYLSTDGWLPLRTVADQTARLTQAGRITLRLDAGPDAKNDKVNGITSYWLRGTVSDRVPSGVVGPLPGGYEILWDHGPAISAVLVTIPGTSAGNTASIIKILRSTITLSNSLSGVAVGAEIVNAVTSALIGRIQKLVGGVTLVLDGVDPGRSITIDGSSTATVIAGLDGTAILDQPLKGLILGAILKDAASGEAVGTLTGFEPDFIVPLDSGLDFQKDDLVTIDSSTSATVTKAEAAAVTLDAAIGGTSQGSQLTLANALPVLRPQGADAAGALPSLGVIRARVGFTKSNLQPDAAACDATPLDLSNTFYPFGKSPQKFTTFYIASKEVFQRQGALVELLVTLAQVGAAFDDNDQPGPAAMTWSIAYFNGDSWVALGAVQKLDDATRTMTAPGTTGISFLCPADWADTKVNGKANHWLRIRIDGGNYGHALRLSVDTSVTPAVVTSDPATLQPPVIAALRLQYTYETNSSLLDHCVTYNDFAFTDHTADARWPRRPFEPFTPVSDVEPGVHFGFSQALPAGLVSLYFAAAGDGSGAVGAATASPFVWEYLSSRGWVEFSVLDETNGFSGSGLIQFIGPPDGAAQAGLGGTSYWVRARLKPDLLATPLAGDGLWLNAVWAHQGETVQQDTLGSSNGNPGQTFIFAPQHVPVLPGEVITVREWQGRGDDWQTAVQGVPAADLQFVTDPSDGVTVTEVWVVWHGQPYFYLSGPSDRHYVLERATGLLELATPPYGMIPPAGASIVASYATGGGLSGNVPAGSINELHTAVSYVQSVANPYPATGGSETEVTDRARDRATQRLRHHNRAVAAADFEWLAREASPEVARARCLPITGPDGTGERGWVTLVVVPDSTDPAPMPTAGLLQEVAAALAAAVPAAIVGQILLAAPTYTAVTVRADIVPRVAGQAAMVEAQIRSRLAAFLHPLTGGDGSGWDFGQGVYLSQLATLIEETDGVDFVSLLQVLVDDGVVGDVVSIDPGALITQGDHQLKLLAEVP